MISHEKPPKRGPRLSSTHSLLLVVVAVWLSVAESSPSSSSTTTISNHHHQQFAEVIEEDPARRLQFLSHLTVIDCPVPSEEGACANINDPVECVVAGEGKENNNSKCEYSSECVAILAGYSPDDCVKKATEEIPQQQQQQQQPAAVEVQGEGGEAATESTTEGAEGEDHSTATATEAEEHSTITEEGEHHSTTTTTAEAKGEHSTTGEESYGHSTATSTSSSHNEDHPVDFDNVGHEGEGEHHHDPGHAVLFPSFSLTLGLVVFYVLTRYCSALPFTAVMFLLGTLMGIGTALLPDNADHVSVTVNMWTNIDSEVLLLVFLPGLIFKDAMGLNVHLFRTALIQCLIFAFPMVLCGTIMTAAVARYVFPYKWGWNLAMTFGSILSATDPVAVAALLEEVGAPPRLKVHIGGEALLNDGAAIVFFTIFAERYYYEVGKEGFGEDVDWGRGFEVFFRMAAGGACIGFMFGVGILLMLYLLDRRFSHEENIVEVTSTLALAYIGYYVAEVVCHTSGVIATVAAGTTVKFLGRASVNDAELMDSFWALVEHILNTILFTLGGAVWGSVIANGEKRGEFVARDWGYMLLLYLLLTVIRGVLFFSVYPITSRIGLKTNLKETFFQVYGGLRGAVGIALAIALDSSIVANVDPDSKFADETSTAFGMIGGIAFLTLVINGTTAGPILIKLGLADSTETRKKIVTAYEAGFKQHMIAEFVKLLSQHRFRNVNFGLVRHHVPYLADMTKTQLVEAIERHRDTTPSDEYQPPYLQGCLPYLKEEPEDEADPVPINGHGLAKSKIRTSRSTESLLKELQAEVAMKEREKRAKNRMKRRRRKSNLRHLMEGAPLSTQEMRTLFISLLKSMYERQIARGELVDREFLAIALQQSLEFAADAVANGGELQDWNFVHIVDGPASSIFNRFKNNDTVVKVVETVWGKGAKKDIKYTVKRLKIERSMNFMAAHKEAQRYILREFEDADSELSEAARVVINESDEQWALAEGVLHSYKRADIESVTSHKFCTILLNSGQNYITKLVKHGLLKDDEAEHWVEEIEEHLEHVYGCTEENHEGELQVDYIADDCGKFRDDNCHRENKNNEIIDEDNNNDFFKETAVAVAAAADGSVDVDANGFPKMNEKEAQEMFDVQEMFKDGTTEDHA